MNFYTVSTAPVTTTEVSFFKKNRVIVYLPVNLSIMWTTYEREELCALASRSRSS